MLNEAPCSWLPGASVCLGPVVAFAVVTRQEARALQPKRSKPPSKSEQERRVAWGHEAGAKVAHAYKLLTEGK